MSFTRDPLSQAEAVLARTIEVVLWQGGSMLRLRSIACEGMEIHGHHFPATTIGADGFTATRCMYCLATLRSDEQPNGGAA